MRRNIAENYNGLSRVHERYRQTTDRETTDGRATAYSEREHELMFAKSQTPLIRFVVDLLYNKLYNKSTTNLASTMKI